MVMFFINFLERGGETYIYASVAFVCVKYGRPADTS